MSLILNAKINCFKQIDLFQASKRHIPLKQVVKFPGLNLVSEVVGEANNSFIILLLAYEMEQIVKDITNLLHFLVG